MRIEIRNSRRRALRYLVVSLIFVACGFSAALALTMLPPNAAGIPPRLRQLLLPRMQVAVWIPTVFFGIGVAVCLWLLIDKRPRLVFDDEGIFDRRLRVGRIAWSDIRSAYVISVGRQEFICLELVDDNKYLAQLTPAWRTFVTKSASIFGVPLFALNLSGVDASADELLEVIRTLTHKLPVDQ